MKRIVSIILLLSLFVSACSTTSAPDTQPVEPTPTLFPGTLSPPEIDAPIVESPSLINIRFVNSTDGWGVTETQIVRTNDGGVTWYDVTPQDVTETGFGVDMFVLDNSHVWVHLPDFGFYPNSGFQYRTTDGGMTWTMSNTPFSRARYQFLDSNNGWVLADLGVGAGSNAIAVYQTTDGGAEWQQTFINDPNNPDAGESLPLGGLKNGLAAFNMTSALVFGVIYAPGESYLYRTENSGQEWAQVSIPLPPDAENADLIIEHAEFITQNDAFLTMRVSSDAANLAVYSSNDGGNTWTLTPTLIPNGGVVDFMSADEIVIYNGDQFYVTRDAARTWSIIPPDVRFGDTLAVMDFVSPSTGWVITVDPTTNHRSLYKTADGGATWFPVVE